MSHLLQESYLCVMMCLVLIFFFFKVKLSGSEPGSNSLGYVKQFTTVTFP